MMELASSEDCPWEVNWAGIGDITSMELAQRKGVSWVTSSIMQQGLDPEGVAFVVLVRPPTNLEDFLQSWGRGGRMQLNGRVLKVVCICLWNMNDVADNVPGMTPEVRDFCINEQNECLRKKLSSVYPGNFTVLPDWCCGPCSDININILN